MRCPQCGREVRYTGGLCSECQRRADAQLEANQAQARLAEEQMRQMQHQQFAQRQADAEQARLIADERARRQAEEKERKRQEKILAKATTRVNEMKEELLELKNRIPLLQNAIDTRDFASIKKLSKDKKKKGSGCLKWALIIIVSFFMLLLIVAKSSAKSAQRQAEAAGVTVQQ